MEISKWFYDNSKEHLGDDFPDSLPVEQAYFHVGMYLGWVIENGMYSGYFEKEASTEIFRFKRREISCRLTGFCLPTRFFLVSRMIHFQYQNEVAGVKLMAE